jgi:predicted DNA-binding protein YlxM (UPF0122 family)
MEKNVEIAFLMDTYGGLLKEKNKTAVELYYFDDLSLSEIADQLGITKQGVRDLIVRTEKFLKTAEESLKIVQKNDEYEARLAEIRSLAVQTKTAGTFYDVQNFAEKIIAICDEFEQN